jgi:uncharacterized repeat protein (TIGR02059 family)
MATISPGLLSDETSIENAFHLYVASGEDFEINYYLDLDSESTRGFSSYTTHDTIVFPPLADFYIHDTLDSIESSTGIKFTESSWDNADWVIDMTSDPLSLPTRNNEGNVDYHWSLPQGANDGYVFSGVSLEDWGSWTTTFKDPEKGPSTKFNKWDKARVNTDIGFSLGLKVLPASSINLYTSNDSVMSYGSKGSNLEFTPNDINALRFIWSQFSNLPEVTDNSPTPAPTPAPTPTPEPEPTPEIQKDAVLNIISATIRGDQITLQFDNALSDTLPRLNSFTLKNGSRELQFKDAEVIASAGQVTLTSNNAIDTTSTVELDYFDLASDQTTGVIQSKSGVDLPSFSGFQINNQTTQENNLAIDDGEFEGNTITLSLNAPIGSAVPSPKRFKVKAGRKSQKIIGINTDPSEGFITLTTKKPVGSYESLKVSYKDLAGDQTEDVIEDKSGNDMKTVRDYEIINGRFDETPPKLVSAELDDNILSMEFDSIISNTKLSKNRFKVNANGKKLKVKSAAVEDNDESFVNLVVQIKRNQIIDLQSEVTLSYSDPKGDQSKQVIEDLFGNDLLSVNSFAVDIV